MRSSITWKMTGGVGRRVKRETDKAKKGALQVQFRVMAWGWRRVVLTGRG